MKNKYFLILFSLFSNVVYSMDINLSNEDKITLIEHAKKENFKRQYWPNNVNVELESFYKKEDEYIARFLGRYLGAIVPIFKDGIIVYMQEAMRRDTTARFSKETLNKLGIQL